MCDNANKPESNETTKQGYCIPHIIVLVCITTFAIIVGGHALSPISLDTVLKYIEHVMPLLLFLAYTALAFLLILSKLPKSKNAPKVLVAFANTACSAVAVLCIYVYFMGTFDENLLFLNPETTIYLIQLIVFGLFTYSFSENKSSNTKAFIYLVYLLGFFVITIGVLNMPVGDSKENISSLWEIEMSVIGTLVAFTQIDWETLVSDCKKLNIKELFSLRQYK